MPAMPSEPLTDASATQRGDTPGWPEVAAGLLGLAIVGYGGGILISRMPLDPIVIGLIFTALSGIGGLAGFMAAYWLRIRSWPAFGVRRTTARWMLMGVGAGIAAFVLKSLSILGYLALTGDQSNPQEIYAIGASGGLWTVMLATLFMTLLTPLGEELLFRGVVTTALLRYGPLVGVVGGALIFALFHGINLVFPAALVTGLIAGEIFRRSGSVWPAVAVHAVVNLPTIPVMVLASAAQ
ncbi:type II CAAX endopeptidase family protein [Mesorhizobium sp. CAU 1741]|uniref:CPBP family intramembrane glutamic endopeptidase n=1 Tax=Mesorhizobium sp. CAU 1741 TaxID=3140366 RepID=UPI00325BE15B